MEEAPQQTKRKFANLSEGDIKDLMLCAGAKNTKKLTQ